MKWRHSPSLIWAVALGLWQAQPSAAQTVASKPAPVHHAAHHPHRGPHHHAPPKLAALPAPPPAPAQTAVLVPAPVPDPYSRPPVSVPDPDPHLSGGNLQIQYPDIGDGFVPGSSSSVIDNEHMPMVPGLSVKLPLSQAPSSNSPP